MAPCFEAAGGRPTGALFQLVSSFPCLLEISFSQFPDASEILIFDPGSFFGENGKTPSFEQRMVKLVFRFCLSFFTFLQLSSNSCGTPPGAFLL